MKASTVRRSAACVALLVFSGLALSCGPRDVGPRRFAGETMGTTFTVTVPDVLPDNVDEDVVGAAILGALDEVNAVFNTYDPDSEISRFNATADTGAYAVSPALGALTKTAQELSAATDGALDITVMPLVDAWGFGPGDPTDPPDDETLARIAAYVGNDKLRHAAAGAAHKLAKAHPKVRCDFSALAKGYGVDRIAGALDALGIEDYLVEIGGEVRARGENGDRAWRIAVEQPVAGKRAIQQVVELTDESMATSGDYRNFRESDGQRLTHIIDPRTRRPVEHSLASVTVLHPACAFADAYATALMVLGPDAGMQFAESESLAVFMLVRTDDGIVERASSRWAARTAGQRREAAD